MRASNPRSNRWRGSDGFDLGLVATGSPAVIFNQAKVEADEAGFLSELHRNLRRLPPAEALRQAALKTLKGRYPDPFYWSRFIVLGKGK
jgi:CHAT domain-containing protein